MLSRAIMYTPRGVFNKPPPFIIRGEGESQLLFAVVMLFFGWAMGFLYPFGGMMFVGRMFLKKNDFLTLFIVSVVI